MSLKVKKSSTGEVDFEFTKPHTHRGEKLAPGSVRPVSKSKAKRYEEQGLGHVVTGSRTSRRDED